MSGLDVSKLGLADKWLVTLVDNFRPTPPTPMRTIPPRTDGSVPKKVVDDISNFYVRINRRRSGKRGDSEDKNTAYTVMLYAIRTISQVMAPAIPFLTEHVWQEVVRRYSNESAESVHLSAWAQGAGRRGRERPGADPGAVGSARHHLLALKLRNEKQVRIRQPPEHAGMCAARTARSPLAPQLESVLASEVNVKSVEFLEDTSALEDAYAVLDFKKAGAVLKGDVNHVKNLLAGLEPEDMQAVAAAVQAGGEVRVPGYDAALSAEIFALKYAPKAHLAVAEDFGVTAALDMTITDELYAEGCLRDILRQCQVFPQGSRVRGVRPDLRSL